MIGSLYFNFLVNWENKKSIAHLQPYLGVQNSYIFYLASRLYPRNIDQINNTQLHPCSSIKLNMKTNRMKQVEGGVDCSEIMSYKLKLYGKLVVVDFAFHCKAMHFGICVWSFRKRHLIGAKFYVTSVFPGRLTHPNRVWYGDYIQIRSFLVTKKPLQIRLMCQKGLDLAPH